MNSLTNLPSDLTQVIFDLTNAETLVSLQKVSKGWRGKVRLFLNKSKNHDISKEVVVYVDSRAHLIQSKENIEQSIERMTCNAPDRPTRFSLILLINQRNELSDRIHRMTKESLDMMNFHRFKCRPTYYLCGDFY